MHHMCIAPFNTTALLSSLPVRNMSLSLCVPLRSSWFPPATTNALIISGYPSSNSLRLFHAVFCILRLEVLAFASSCKPGGFWEPILAYTKETSEAGNQLCMTELYGAKYRILPQHLRSYTPEMKRLWTSSGYL